MSLLPSVGRNISKMSWVERQSLKGSLIALQTQDLLDRIKRSSKIKPTE
jgi:hypothetical protein